MLAGHSALGLFFAALLYLICLSGTMIVFYEDISEWEQPGYAAGQPTDASLQHMLEAIHAHGVEQSGPLHSVTLFTERRDEGRVTARYLSDSSVFEAWIADPQSGALLQQRHAPFSEFIEDVHVRLRMGAIGLYLIGLAGVAMLSLTVSGVLAHPRIFRDAFHFRRGGARRLSEADVHNRLSVWALPFHLMISFTGAFLGLAFLIVAILAFVAFDGDQAAAVRAVLGPQPTESAEAAPLPDVEALLADARARSGLERFNNLVVEHPATMGQVTQLELEAPNDLAPGETFFYDANGVFLESSGSADGGIGAQTLAAMGPLHFGSFGGLLIRLAWVGFGLASTLVVSTGVTIWLARRREQGRAAPRWERVWSAAIWGGAIACIAPFFTAPLGEAWANPAFFAALVCALIVAALTPDWVRCSRILRATLAALVLAMCALNITRNYPEALTGAPLWVNAALCLIALALGASLFARKPKIAITNNIPEDQAATAK